MFTILYNIVLIVVRQEVKSLDSLVVVHGLELAINRYLYGPLCSSGNQYNVGSLPCISSTNTPNLAAT